MKGHYPVDINGNMLECDYPDYVHGWLPMGDFTDTLEFEHCVKGRSSLRLIYKRSNNTKVSVMANSIDQFILNSVLGSLTGVFSIVKWGTNYGVILKEVI